MNLQKVKRNVSVRLMNCEDAKSMLKKTSIPLELKIAKLRNLNDKLRMKILFRDLI